MNLKYNLLWFEDDPEVVESEVGPEIKEYLESLGFEYNCIHKEEGSDLEVITNDKKFDLILTDLNMEEDLIGKKIIDQIRNDNIYTEVLLYSANAESINKIINESKSLIERVSFFVGTKNLSEKVKKIISLTIKKVQDVTNMRGLVIASAIDLEIEMENIIKSFFKLIGDKKEDEKREKILKSMYDNKVTRDKESLEKIINLDHTNIEKLIEEGILTATNIYDAMMSAIKLLDNELVKKLDGLKAQSERQSITDDSNKIKEVKKQLQSFQKDVISLRNTLAHVKEETNDEGVPVLRNIKINGEAIIFNDEKYIEIRKNIQTYRNIIVDVKARLSR